ncbi:MAG: archease, partial [Gemmatimonadetes bacterium]|nr:archease [Gemmatimonadota bacterium]
ALHLAGDSPAALLDALTSGISRLVAGEAALPEHTRITLDVRADSLEDLLVRWANELIFRFDSDGLLPVCGLAPAVTQDAAGTWRAGAHLPACRTRTIPFDQECDLKAATYHRLRVRRRGGRLSATIVIDT